MVKKCFFQAGFLFMAFILLATSVQARQPGSVGEFRFPVGLTFIGGFFDFKDAVMDSAGRRYTSTTPIPVGVSFQPYYEFDFGLRIGGGIGPFGFVLGDVTTALIPLNVNVGYTFLPEFWLSPYIRGGMWCNVAFGDEIDSFKPGGFIGGGIEFIRTKVCGVGVDFVYTFESSKVEFDRPFIEPVDPTHYAISVFAVF